MANNANIIKASAGAATAFGLFPAMLAPQLAAFSQHKSRNYTPHVKSADPSLAQIGMPLLVSRNLPEPVMATVPSLEQFVRTKAEVQASFVELLQEWRDATMIESNQVSVLMHPAHYKIIGMGPQVLPDIFADLKSGGGPWYLALESITHENPVPEEDRSSARKARLEWIRWGMEHGYITA